MFTKRNLQHIAAWSLFFGYESMMHFIIFPPDDWWEPFLFLLPEALYFYSYRALMTRFSNGFLERRNWRKLVPFLLLLLLSFCMVTIVMRFLFSYWEQQSHPPGYMKLYIASAVFRGIYLAMLASFLWLAESIIEKNKLLAKEQLKLKEQEIEILQINQKLLMARNELYKAQIKPHILFNTLNFVHNEVADSPKASSSILLLTEILRFALEHDDEQGMVLLEDEWNQVINYVTLQKMRFEKPMQLDIAFMNRKPGMRIPPLILLTLVENMFMHGNLFHIFNPATIQLTTDESGWQIKTTNAKRSGSKDPPGHKIGLNNIRNRLDFKYGAGNVHLQLDDELDSYRVMLSINYIEHKNQKP